MPEAIMVVLSNANPEREHEFNDWYTRVHILEVLNDLEGFDTAQRFRLADGQVEDSASYRYLAIYHIKPGALDAARAAVTAQRTERLEALAAGREPRIKLDTGLFSGQHAVWFLEAITDVVSAGEGS